MGFDYQFSDKSRRKMRLLNKFNKNMTLCLGKIIQVKRNKSSASTDMKTAEISLPSQEA